MSSGSTATVPVPAGGTATATDWIIDGAIFASIGILFTILNLFQLYTDRRLSAIKAEKRRKKHEFNQIQIEQQIEIQLNKQKLAAQAEAETAKNPNNNNNTAAKLTSNNNNYNNNSLFVFLYNRYTSILLLLANIHSITDFQYYHHLLLIILCCSFTAVNTCKFYEWNSATASILSVVFGSIITVTGETLLFLFVYTTIYTFQQKSNSKLVNKQQQQQQYNNMDINNELLINNNTTDGNPTNNTTNSTGNNTNLINNPSLINNTNISTAKLLLFIICIVLSIILTQVICLILAITNNSFIYLTIPRIFQSAVLFIMIGFLIIYIKRAELMHSLLDESIRLTIEKYYSNNKFYSFQHQLQYKINHPLIDNKTIDPIIKIIQQQQQQQHQQQYPNRSAAAAAGGGGGGFSDIKDTSSAWYINNNNDIGTNGIDLTNGNSNIGIITAAGGSGLAPASTALTSEMNPLDAEQLYLNELELAAACKLSQRQIINSSKAKRKIKFYIRHLYAFIYIVIAVQIVLIYGSIYSFISPESSFRQDTNSLRYFWLVLSNDLLVFFSVVFLSKRAIKSACLICIHSEQYKKQTSSNNNNNNKQNIIHQQQQQQQHQQQLQLHQPVQTPAIDRIINSAGDIIIPIIPTIPTPAPTCIPVLDAAELDYLQQQQRQWAHQRSLEPDNEQMLAQLELQQKQIKQNQLTQQQQNQQQQQQQQKQPVQPLPKSPESSSIVKLQPNPIEPATHRLIATTSPELDYDRAATLSVLINRNLSEPIIIREDQHQHHHPFGINNSIRSINIQPIRTVDIPSVLELDAAISNNQLTNTQIPTNAHYMEPTP